MDIIQLALVHYFDGNIWEWNPSIRPQDIETFELISSKPCEVVKIGYYQLPPGMKEINDSTHKELRFYKEGSGNYFTLKNTNGCRPILIGDHWNEKYILKKYKIPRMQKNVIDELENEE
jgi:hypothetical protein